MTTTMTPDRLGAHLEANGAATVLLPGPAGDDYLAATIDGLTIEVFYTGGDFVRSIVTGPGVNATYDNQDELLRQLSMPTGDDAADLAAAFQEFWRSLPPSPRYVNGRIVGDPVRVGDVWACYSIRERGRTFRIDAVEDGYCYGIVLTNSDEVNRQLLLAADNRAAGRPPYEGSRDLVGAMVKIRLDRMRPTADGYYRMERTGAS